MPGNLRRWTQTLLAAVVMVAAAVGWAAGAGLVPVSLPSVMILFPHDELREERALQLDLKNRQRDADEMEPDEPVRLVEYEVARGETLWSLARRFGLSLDTLAQVNGITDPNRIRAGDRLMIPPQDGIMYRVPDGESVWRVAERFGVGVSELVAANVELGLDMTGGRLFVPGARAQVRVAAGDVQGAQPRLLWPVRGRITSGFGPRWGRWHAGIDVAAPQGTQVRAAEGGRVTSVGWLGGYGRTVMIDHGGDLKTLYGHLSTVYVRTGQTVLRGEVVGLVGSTGNSTGPHLHFEVRKGGTYRDPIAFLTSGW